MSSFISKLSSNDLKIIDDIITKSNDLNSFKESLNSFYTDYYYSSFEKYQIMSVCILRVFLLNYKVVELLLKMPGIDVGLGGWQSPLGLAILTKNQMLTQLFLNHSIDIKRDYQFLINKGYHNIAYYLYVIKCHDNSDKLKIPYTFYGCVFYFLTFCLYNIFSFFGIFKINKDLKIANNFVLYLSEVNNLNMPQKLAIDNQNIAEKRGNFYSNTRSS